MKKKIIISQKDNYDGNFGEVLRSSSIFYVNIDDKQSTTISILNYWFIRNKINVRIILNIRDMAGKLIRRENVSFDEKMVINYTPNFSNFEGSIEVEVFSLVNLTIPYAAIMAIYTSKESVSMVHSYTRIYSNHEIEEHRTITTGRESCWTIKDSNSIQSFCILHNGHNIQPEQKSKILITTAENKHHIFEIIIPKLEAYSTHKVILKDEIEGLVELLKKQPANVSISFELNSCFTRLLVGNENTLTGDMQITHSNFDYREHQTDLAKDGHSNAYMSLIDIPEYNLKTIIYPDMHEGSYQVTDGDDKFSFKSGDRVEYTPKNKIQIFTSLTGIMPTRIVTAITGGLENKLPFECSLGIVTKDRPKKRMWWGTASCSNTYEGKLFIVSMEDIYGEIENEPLIIRLYSSNSLEYLEKTINLSKANLLKLQSGILFTDLFDDANSFLSNSYGYYTTFSEYGGLFVYSSIQSQTGSITIEHGF